jgi:hypothetical protein
MGYYQCTTYPVVTHPDTLSHSHDISIAVTCHFSVQPCGDQLNLEYAYLALGRISNPGKFFCFSLVLIL